MKYYSFLLVIFAFHLQYWLCVSDYFGFTSIDCGSANSSSYNSVPYSTDAGFIDSGENHNISPSYRTNVPDQIQNLRSFPVGQRNCYNLSVAAGSKGNKYIIRAHFLYGNYDGKNELPQFDLYLGVEKWDTITTDSPDKYLWWEIIHMPSSNYLYVCLVNTGKGIPYISALEIRPMDPRAYSDDPQDSMKFFQRLYFAPNSPNQVIRYPDDLFDRRWSPFSTPTYWEELKSTATIDNTDSYEFPPPVVLQSAVTPKDNASNLILNFHAENIKNTSFSFCFHFSEVEQIDQPREFDLYLNGVKLQSNITLEYFMFIDSEYFNVKNNTKDFNFTLQKSAGSAYPPVLSAVEMFEVTRFLQSQTDENDVFAMVNIKATYGLNKSNWQGDPCLPRDFLWEGLDCVTFDNQSTPPRIKYLDLSSSGVSGLITPYLSGLKSLEFLDLSHNNLSGQIPDFLAELPSLKVLNLTGNNFIGPVPQKLTDKANNGSLLLRINDTDLKKKNGVARKLLIKILALSLVALLLSLAIALFIIYRKRIINQDGELLRVKEQKDVDTGDRSEKFTMAEIKKMTKKYKNPIGKGGFGQVFRGTMTDGTEVAVKRLSPQSTQGHQQLKAEVKLLKRACHQNLTPILGYCDEGQEMAIVYKYMPNGSLNNFLCPDNKKVLTWRHRLRIAFGATQGLKYLHEIGLIHRDVKPENILLDEKLEAKLGDYGLVRETVVDKTHVTTARQGTDGYMDPEYGENDRLREKSDVYSMGVVLLRLITGKPLAIRLENEVKHITHWLKDVDVTNDKQMRAIVDPKLEGNFDLESVKKAFTLATNCANPKSDSRPTTSEVVKELEECLKLASGQ